MLRIPALLSLGILSATCAMAQNGSQAAAADPPVIRVSTEFAMLDVLVEEKKTGTLIGNLDARDFRVTEDGVPQQISYVSHDRLPLSVVFLFDLTDTVRPILKPLAQGALEVLGHLKPEDEVAVMVFSSHTELIQEFTSDRKAAAAAIEKASEMKSKEGTFIHEDMHEAVEQAMRSTVPESRRVMVWLTDGTANLENSLTQKTIGQHAPVRLHTKAESTAELMRSGVVVSALFDRSAGTDAFIVAADANPFSFLFGARVGDIRRYAEMTGGPTLKTTKQEVATRLGELIDQLRGRYTLGYKPSAAKPEGAFCNVKVTLNPAALKERTELRGRDIMVRSKQGYYR
jgi:VWFA-related protein